MLVCTLHESSASTLPTADSVPLFQARGPFLAHWSVCNVRTDAHGSGSLINYNAVAPLLPAGRTTTPGVGRMIIQVSAANWWVTKHARQTCLPGQCPMNMHHACQPIILSHVSNDVTCGQNLHPGTSHSYTVSECCQMYIHISICKLIGLLEGTDKLWKLASYMCACYIYNGTIKWPAW